MTDRRPDSFTDYMHAWRSIPKEPATDAEIQTWLDRAAWLRSRLAPYNRSDVALFNAGWEAVSGRAGREAHAANEALKGEALRAGVFWLETPDGWRVNPNWREDIEAIQDEARAASMSELGNAAREMKTALAAALDALIQDGAGR